MKILKFMAIIVIAIALLGTCAFMLKNIRDNTDVTDTDAESLEPTGPMISGIWDLSLDGAMPEGFPITFEVNFTSNGNTYSSITFGTLESGGDYDVYYDDTQVCGCYSWSEDAFKYVDFGTGASASEEFIAFMEEHKDKLEVSGPYNVRSSFDCNAIDESVDFTFGGKNYIGILVHSPEGDPLLTLVHSDGALNTSVGSMGFWNLDPDADNTFFFGSEPQPVSIELWKWIQNSLVKAD